ncbi:MAG TPA: TadE/TadG family type IV pilus assembly protein [Thermohalobaculum sp.]|nr:TadE/TadG family type IV pilus assembly protein [Thermohalobaculum sp.]
MILRTLRRGLADQRGAAAVEMALILVPLVLLLVGIVDFGRVLYTRNNLIGAADVGARVILIDNAASDAAVTDAVHEAFLAAPDDQLTVTLGTASESGIGFRTISLEHDIALVTPLLVVDRITLDHTRRVPLE